jgi:transcriptional regulator with XRE-family HTH domain
MHRFDDQQVEARRIGERLRWAREAQNITRLNLATYAGIDWTMIRHIEHGRRVPSVFLVMSLCHILRISPQYLLWGVLSGLDEELHTKLAREHPELLAGGSVRHSAMPNPGKTRRTKPSIVDPDAEVAQSRQ